MAVIEDLSVELFGEIFSHLGCVDLGKICRVSPLFNHIAERFLYRKVWLSRPNLKVMAITSFLRAVLVRPALARNVRLLSLGRCSEDGDYGSDSCLPTAQDSSLFSEASNRLELQTLLWTEGAQVFLLLHLLPNLQHLTVAGCRILNTFLDDSLAVSVESFPAGLKSLHVFHDAWDGEPADMTPTMVLALMRLPSIRKIITDMEPAYHTNDPGTVDKLISPPEYRGSSSVTTLSFQYGNFHTSLLSTILQVPRALTHFSYADHDDCPAFDLTMFREALIHLRPTLQYLYLGWIRALEIGESGEDDEKPHTIGSLRDWPALRTVHCGLVALVGKPAVATSRLADVVPAVIRELGIDRVDDVWFMGEVYNEEEQWTVSDMTDHLVELLERKKECGLDELSVLTVSICSWIPDLDENQQDNVHSEALARLEAACVKSGVQVTVGYD